MKILTIIGARPQFVKAAPVSRALTKYDIQEVSIHTGQHYDKNMSQLFFDELKMKKEDYNLGIGSGSHGEQTGKMLIEIEKVINIEKPNLVLIYGDTNSTLAGALAASKLHISIAHIEAGLRSYNMKMPEEVNRILSDRISNILFCPTITAVSNLKKEGIISDIHKVGDVMYDATLENASIAEKKSDILKQLGVEKKKYILATIHRAENTDSKDRLTSIINAFIESNEKIILPLHPRTKKCLEKYNLLNKINNSKIVIIDPVGYFDMLTLEKNARKIATDSGGVQKEAFFMKVPCITLRDETEWIETVKSGNNELVGADEALIIKSLKNVIQFTNDEREYFGNGNASAKIAKILKESYIG